jgi:UDP-D-galactose:(glucosyl)LPS alpha-1,6-D-galactosyltransferase
MLTVDIVCPTGGRGGGIENVIKSWTKHIDHSRINLRIFHMTSGMAYLEGYEKAYCLDKPFEKYDYAYCVAAYDYFIGEAGAPDICIATNWPVLSKVCVQVREQRHLSYKVVSWVHNRVDVYEETGLGGITEMLYADAHFVINRDIKNELLKADPTAKVYLVWNPVDLQQTAAYHPQPMTLAYVGRLSEIKRVDIILEAMYRAKGDWKLKIIGDGEIRENVESWITLLKLNEQVQLLGWKEHPWEECLDTGILVMASEYEGFGLVAFEASSLGMTVLSTPVSGITDYIIPGLNGYLYPQEDAQALADILDSIEYGPYEICDPQQCIASVKEFSTEAYFDRIHTYLMEISEVGNGI